MGRNFSRFVTSTRPEPFHSPEFSVFILSSNYNPRMKGIGPKGMIPIGNDYLVRKQIETIRSAYPKAEIYLTIGYDADSLIKQAPPGVRLIENQVESNEAAELRLALQACPSNRILIINGDTLFDKQSIEGFRHDQTNIFFVNKDVIPRTEIGMTLSEGKCHILNFSLHDFKWSNIIYLTGDELHNFRKLCSDRAYSNLFFFEMVNLLLQRFDGIFAFEHPGMIKRLTTIKDIKEINENTHS